MVVRRPKSGTNRAAKGRRDREPASCPKALRLHCDDVNRRLQPAGQVGGGRQIKGNEMADKNDWQGYHEWRGCPNCFYADGKMIGKGACCTYIGAIQTEPITGKCLTRKEVLKH